MRSAYNTDIHTTLVTTYWRVVLLQYIVGTLTTSTLAGLRYIINIMPIMIATAVKKVV